MGGEKNVLVVDDNEVNLFLAKKILSKDYAVETVNSGTDAIEYLANNQPDLVLLDISMPDISGIEVMKEMREMEQHKNTPVIFLTAVHDTETEASCLERGAADFITKPFETRIMLNRVKKTIEYEDLRRNLSKQVQEKSKENELLAVHSITAIANTIDAKDRYTKGHSVRVAEYAAAIAREYGYSEEEVTNLHNIALLHDIGKIGVPDSILNKNEKLTEKEYEIIKSHCSFGAEILKDIRSIKDVEAGAKYHHERIDGRGYPEGIKGDEIPEVAKIISVADAFDAMTSNRCYRDDLPYDRVRTELLCCKGTQFDPVFVDILISLWDRGIIDPKRSQGLNVVVHENSKLMQLVMEQQIKVNSEEASKDFLTGLHNRRYFESRVEELLGSHDGALLLIDMDNFKLANDMYGHQHGDMVLRTLADILSDELEGNDIASRFGGDEFVYYIDDVTSIDEANQVAKRILDKFCQVQEEDFTFRACSLSIGIALSVYEGRNFSELYRKADKALYFVKQNGKNSFYCYSRQDKDENLLRGKRTTSDIEQLTKMIQNKKIDGSFQVDYFDFRNLLEVIKRMSERDHKQFRIVLFTLVLIDNDEILETQEHERALLILKEAICQHLRKVDISAQYSSMQYVVMLVDTNGDTQEIAQKRILENFYKMYDGTKFSLEYDNVFVNESNEEYKG